MPATTRSHDFWLRCDFTQIREFQRRARAEGMVPGGPEWERVPPEEAAALRADLEERERLWAEDRPMREQWIRDNPHRLDEAMWLQEHREDAAAEAAGTLAQRREQRRKSLIQGPLWRRSPGEPVVVGRVYLPAKEEEMKDSRPSRGRPRKRPGRPRKLTDEKLRQSLTDYPDLTNAERTERLNQDLGLPDPKDPKSRALHPKTVGDRVRKEQRRDRWPEGIRSLPCLNCERTFPSESKAQRLCRACADSG